MNPKALVAHTLNHFVQQGNVTTLAGANHAMGLVHVLTLIAATNMCGHMQVANMGRRLPERRQFMEMGRKQTKALDLCSDVPGTIKWQDG